MWKVIMTKFSEVSYCASAISGVFTRKSFPIETTLKNLIFLSFHLFLIVTGGLFFTWTIRQWLLPAEAAFEKPLNFVFQTCEHGGVCSFPMANVTIRSPKGLPFFERSLPYRIYLDLTLVDSPANREIGMFLSVLSVFGQRADIALQTFSRSAVVPYRSRIFRWIRTLVNLPFLLVGLKEEKDAISLTFDENFYDNPFDPVVWLSVELQHEHIQVSDSELRIYAVFGVFRSFLYYWPLTSSVLLFCILGTFFGSIAGLYWTRKSACFVLKTLDDFETERIRVRTKSETERMEKKVPETRKDKIPSRPQKNLPKGENELNGILKSGKNNDEPNFEAPADPSSSRSSSERRVSFDDSNNNLDHADVVSEEMEIRHRKTKK